MDDFYRELHELYKIARSWYILAVKNHIKTEDFMALFEHSHHYIECNSAQCNNARRMMIGIIRELLRDKQSILEIEEKEKCSGQDLVELYLQRISADQPVRDVKSSIALTLGCKLSEKQIDLLVELIRSHKIFEIVDGVDLRSTLKGLFRCDPNFFIYVENVRNVAMLFDAMAQYHLINNNWQYIMERGGFLRTYQKGGKIKHVSASCLSSSLSRTRKGNYQTASKFAIYKTIEQILREE